MAALKHNFAQSEILSVHSARRETESARGRRLRLFANLGERFDLVSKHPFFIGSSLRFEVKNIFDAKPSVRGGDGAIPFAYYPDRLEPIGRTVGITFRKQFLPTRFLRFGGGGGPGGRGGAGGPPPR